MQFIVSNQTNPYWNIAVEQYLVECAESPTLYLWKNHRTVVIGQNQNPYNEVNLEALLGEGGYLMRRRTGGGAVYHDDGNLNFSFVIPKELYDQNRQFRVIQRAVESFGLHTELSGRNDILVDVEHDEGTNDGNKRKFSGNAFSKGRINDLHHGTLLINGDMSDLARYLKPKPAKLQKHGVQSVRSRVVNLAEINPAISAESIVLPLRQALCEEYGGNLEEVSFSEIIARPAVRRLYEELASDAWLYGRWRNFKAQRSGQFEWGEVEISLGIEGDIVKEVELASDALDIGALDEARRLLTGADIKKRPPTESAIVSDILSLVY